MISLNKFVILVIFTYCHHGYCLEIFNFCSVNRCNKEFIPSWFRFENRCRIQTSRLTPLSDARGHESKYLIIPDLIVGVTPVSTSGHVSYLHHCELISSFPTVAGKRKDHGHTPLIMHLRLQPAPWHCSTNELGWRVEKGKWNVLNIWQDQSEKIKPEGYSVRQKGSNDLLNGFLLFRNWLSNRITLFFMKSNRSLVEAMSKCENFILYN